MISARASWSSAAPTAQETGKSMPRVLSTAVALVIAALMLKAVLDTAYLTLMRDLFAADSTIDAGPGRLVLSYALAALAAMAVSLDVGLRPGPGNVASLLYLCLVVVPMLTLFAFGAQYSDPVFIVAVVVCLAIVVATRVAVPAIRPPTAGPVQRNVLRVLLVAMTAYVYGGLLATRGLHQMNFDLAAVYTFRAEFERETFPLSNYLIAWQAYVVNMAILASVAYGGRWGLMIAMLAAQVLLFGMTNHKAFLLAPALVLGVLWLGRSPVRVAWGIVVGGTFVVLASWGLFLLTDDVMIPSILVRRLFFVPAELHLWYYDFFSSLAHPLLMLSNSVLAAASPYPYADPVPTLIGWAYLGVETSANAGWLADAFAHFGLGGMVVFSLILGLFLRVVDGFAIGVPRSLATAVVAVPAMALVNSGLFTVLLTHGFMLTVVVLWAMSGAGRDRHAS